jgi:hypothetical protein
MANVMPAWLGAISAWLLKCPAELQAQRPIDIDTNLQQYSISKQIHFICPNILFHQTFYFLNFRHICKVPKRDCYFCHLCFSVQLYNPIKQLGSHWVNYHEILDRGFTIICHGNSDFVKMKLKLQANYIKTYLHLTNLVTNITLSPTMPVFLSLQWFLALPLISELRG